MERNTQKHGIINLVALLLVGAAALAVAEYGRSLSGEMTVVWMGLAGLVAAVSWFQMRLEERERIEKLEFDELSRSAAGSALFTATETEVFPARRSREQFERYFVPVFTLLLCVLEIGGALFLWRSVHKAGAPTLNQPLVILGLYGMFFLLLFLLGRFSASLARLESLRLVRPAATYLLLNAYLCLLVALGILPLLAGFVNVDRYLAFGFVGLLLLIGIETLINLVLEVYRPRVKGKIGRPMYESRLVSLLGQPEGLLRTAAHTLDYQFGFKVSETWAYRLLARWLPWMLLGQGAALIISTTAVFIDSGEQAVLEHFGKFEKVLPPGAHFKYPWPVDQVHRFPSDRIQTVEVGFAPEHEEDLEAQRAMRNAMHAKDENFLVANRDTSAAESTNDSSGRRLPPVSMLAVSIPVNYQITNLVEWLYNHEDPGVLLQYLATRQVVHYLASVDYDDILSQGRGRAAGLLRDRIQTEADRHTLGVRIISLGLQDLHPPKEVAPEYEKVVAALHTAEANILDAQAYQTQTNLLAEAQAFKLLSQAESDRWRQRVDASARAALFTNQLPAYLASPSVYTNRAYWEMFAQAAPNVRKFIILVTNSHETIVLNLEDRISEEYLGGLSVPGPPSLPATNR